MQASDDVLMNPTRLMEELAFADNRFLFFHTSNLVKTYRDLMALNAAFHLATENTDPFNIAVFRRLVLRDYRARFPSKVAVNYGLLTTGYLAISSFSVTQRCVISLGLAYTPTPKEMLILTWMDEMPYVSMMPDTVTDTIETNPVGDILTLSLKPAMYIPQVYWPQVKSVYYAALERSTFLQSGVDMESLPEPPAILQ